MLSYIQEYAPPGPPVDSISFDLVTKLDGMTLVRQGDRQPHWSNCSDAPLAIQSWIDQLGIASRTCRDCLRLANQRQRRVRTRAEFSMAARCEWPDHPDPDGPATKASVSDASISKTCRPKGNLLSLIKMNAVKRASFRMTSPLP